MFFLSYYRFCFRLRISPDSVQRSHPTFLSPFLIWDDAAEHLSKCHSWDGWSCFVFSCIIIFSTASMRVLRHVGGLCEQIPFHPSALLPPEDCCSPESMQAHTRGILNRQKYPVVLTGEMEVTRISSSHCSHPVCGPTRGENAMPTFKSSLWLGGISLTVLE